MSSMLLLKNPLTFISIKVMTGRAFWLSSNIFAILGIT